MYPTNLTDSQWQVIQALLADRDGGPVRKRKHALRNVLNALFYIVKWGLLLAIVVHRADIDERRGAGLVLARLHKARVNFPRLQVIFADGGYSGDFETQVKKTYQWLLKIIRKPFGIKTFVLLPKRWIVERTFAWLTNQR